MDNNIINEEIVIGSRVVGNENSDYEGLEGEVFDIKEGPNEETDNIGKVFYVSFDVPTNPKMISVIEERFSELYRCKKTVEDIIFDEVIMCEDMLDLVNDDNATF